jgi:hypothetical protein
MSTTCRLICIVNQTMTAKDNQGVVTNQIGVIFREFKIKFSALVRLLCVHYVYASTYIGLSSGSKFNC